MTADLQPADDRPVVVVLMGVSGSGKTTVAAILSEMLRWDSRRATPSTPRRTWPRWLPGIR